MPPLKEAHQRAQQSWIEWSLVTLLLALCLVLSVLQYRWTGEVSRAEAERLRLQLSEQSLALANAFDAELAGACAALIPSRTELRDQNCADAFYSRWRDWRATNPRPIFRRVAATVPAQNTLDLFMPDERAGQAVRSDWPTDWSPLRQFATRMLEGGRPGLTDRSGEFMEFPIFGARTGGDRGGGERGWLLVQLDLEYLRLIWLPELVRSLLNLGDAQPCHVTVIEAASNRTVFTTVPDSEQAGQVVFTSRFHRDGQFAAGSRNGPPGRRVNSDGGLWILKVQQRPGALEALVSASRWRNLGLALLVNGLILGAGTALVLHTRRARALADERMRFVATVSHELRTPLTVIRGAGHNLLRGIAREPKQIEEYSRLIIQHADQLKDLVDQTLVLAGASRSGEPPRRQRVDLPDLLSQAHAAVADETMTAGCEVVFEHPISLPAVSGDPAELRRVFQNLIANAAKHAAAGRWIEVTTTTGKTDGATRVEVRVSDRGPGIPANEQSDIFKPFFRGAEAQAKQTRGSGLGLSVVREIVQAHGGSVSVASTPGNGATFTVRLPIAETPNA